ncbi:hypothetical protein B0H14DRAFT_2612944 [Mycena olivaceomarginata]|nr:hypothetical protein B0H14DRAFT_2612944 [Mycena olivaceomarginata]
MSNTVSHGCTPLSKIVGLRTAPGWILGGNLELIFLALLRTQTMISPGGVSYTDPDAFSSASLTATLQHNQLSPEMFEALPSLKNAYRNGHIGTSEEGHNRVIDFLDVFDGDLDDTDEVSGEWEWFDYFYALLLHVLYTRWQ